MREIRLVTEESTQTSLVFVDDQENQYFVVVDDSLRTFFTGDDDTAEPEPQLEEKSEASSPVHTVEETAPTPRSLPEPDPLYSTPLTLPPREIQARIRAGSSVEELAQEMGVAVSRIESYAHPVLLERERIAELAKSSHPIREDGPAKLTLAEVLSAAFGARGHSLESVTWDAYREPSSDWVIRLSWKAGLTDNEAEFTFHLNSVSDSTTQPRNAVAADLTDPDFIQPVRSLTSVHGGTTFYEDTDSPETESETPQDDDDVEDFLQHPEEQPEKPVKRRRKAVTPHWEDVLLGVRTNTKRPRD